jgi:hypothetical protein
MEIHMRSGLLAVLLLSLAGPGCATKIYQGPTSGRAAEAQIAVATSVDRALTGFDTRPFSGRRVLIEVHGLTERLEGESPEEAYVRSALVEKLLHGGAQLASSIDDAQLLVSVTLQSAGVDIIRRDFPFIYNHHTFRALTSARIVAYNVTNKIASSIVSSNQVRAEAIYREIYIFYVIGPIQSRE